MDDPVRSGLRQNRGDHQDEDGLDEAEAQLVRSTREVSPSTTETTTSVRLYNR
jgi:hypothetical protein